MQIYPKPNWFDDSRRLGEGQDGSARGYGPAIPTLPPLLRSSSSCGRAPAPHGHRETPAMAGSAMTTVTAFWQLIAELKVRPAAAEFITALRERLESLRDLPAPEARQKLGVSGKFLEVAKSGGGTLPPGNK
jgi:hypothetical protein